MPSTFVPFLGIRSSVAPGQVYSGQGWAKPEMSEEQHPSGEPEESMLLERLQRE